MSEILLVLLLIIPTVWALIDLVRVPSETWTAYGQSQSVWAIVILLAAPLLGALLYVVMARPDSWWRGPTPVPEIQRVLGPRHRLNLV